MANKKQRKERLKRANDIRKKAKHNRPIMIFGVCVPCDQCIYYPRYCDRMSEIVEKEIKLFGIVLYRKTKKMRNDFCSEGRHKKKYNVPNEAYIFTED